ncbi:DUF4349 domain-containing protein [Microcella daejeonensis]|uniref:DUF4349 domain-containing protein n=1 Tax=Microcella daejeonensis TaxID=2994971 RepID=UPI0022719A3C|nr:DUF4349 domain-containing protein [Microcella daejeonensis]WAB85086.1 DUF4349 domain-containing protein [Microcella daejeonensis]
MTAHAARRAQPASPAGSSRSTRAARRSRGGALAASLALLLLLAGCTGAADSASDESGGFVGPDGMPMPAETFQPGVDAPTGESGGDADGGGTGDLVDGSDAGREVITTGSLYVTVAEPLDAAAEAARIVERAGGRVDGRNEFAPRQGDRGGAELVLRIPSEQLTEVIDELQQLGESEELSLSASDVTHEVRDVEARIGALSSSVERLLALQGSAGDVEELIALETAISDRQAELESLQSQQRALADQVSLSTLRLTLGSEQTAPVDEPDTFLSGLQTGWDALLALLSGALVVLGVLLPWLLVLGLIVLVALLVLRRARRRHEAERAAAGDAVMPAPSASPQESAAPAAGAPLD